MPRLHHNHLPTGLSQEQAAARRADVVPVEIPSAVFEALAAARVRMIFVVPVNGALLAAPRRHHEEDISHAVLADGDPVLAADEFDAEIIGPQFFVSSLNNMSGHYQPSADGLAIAHRAFETAGISVRPDAINSYDWEAP
ncbi:MAG: hypothetical protein OXH86_07165 [Acidimicrobiaceae bacterium]|nr:hypothetical protein [Acidimicrobiaceae bacterium]